MRGWRIAPHRGGEPRLSGYRVWWRLQVSECHESRLTLRGVRLGGAVLADQSKGLYALTPPITHQLTSLIPPKLTVNLQIKLSAPSRQGLPIPRPLPHLLKEVSHSTADPDQRYLGTLRVVLHTHCSGPSQPLQHLRVWSTSPIAITEEDHSFRTNIEIMIAGVTFEYVVISAVRVVIDHRGHVGEDLGAVQADPIESGEGKLITALVSQ